MVGDNTRRRAMSTDSTGDDSPVPACHIRNTHDIEFRRVEIEKVVGHYDACSSCFDGDVLEELDADDLVVVGRPSACRVMHEEGAVDSP